MSKTAAAHAALVAAGMDRYCNRPEQGQMHVSFADLEGLRDQAAVRRLVKSTDPETTDKGLLWKDVA